MRVSHSLLFVLLPTVVNANADGTSWRDFRLGMGEEEFARTAVTLSDDREVNQIWPQIGEPNAGVQVLSLVTNEERYVEPEVPYKFITITNGRIFRFIGGQFLAGKLNRLEVCIPKDWMNKNEILAKSRERYGATDVPYTFASIREMVPSVWEGPPGHQHRAKSSKTYTGRLWRFGKTFFLAYGDGDSTCLILQDPTEPISLVESAKRSAEKSKQQIRKKERKEVDGIRF